MTQSDKTQYLWPAREAFRNWVPDEQRVVLSFIRHLRVAVSGVRQFALTLCLLCGQPIIIALTILYSNCLLVSLPAQTLGVQRPSSRGR